MTTAAPQVHRKRLASGTLTLQIDHTLLPLEQLLGYAVRQNPRRGFLFVSRVLGKHLPVSPLRMAEVHRLLADQLSLDLPGPVLAIGLAETATGLGEGVARTWQQRTGRTDLTFLHSTRYHLQAPLALHFEEPHSHATAHRVYLPASPEGQRHFREARTLLLIDDEVSTGTTLLNLAAAYLQLNPAVARVVVVSLTDWCGERGQFERQLGVPVQSVSLLQGTHHFTPDPGYHPPVLPAVSGNGQDKTSLLAPHSARLGLDARDTPLMRAAQTRLGQELSGLPSGSSVLLLGSGEFQYLPFWLAHQLQVACPHLRLLTSATTRSPILPGEAIAHRLDFMDNYQDGIPNYLYNVAPGQFARVYVAHEGEAGPDPQLLATLNATALRLA
ncbi:phosphoribosyltransferase domain-containing protein [Deinococcus sonorensis]|uniref:Phosphoribosyltransferase domain-containing protein n=2 Tax=Deinococcus sonorensis TaxID=309891 RepID=A0AAU7UCA5_9DEIO